MEPRPGHVLPTVRTTGSTDLHEHIAVALLGSNPDVLQQASTASNVNIASGNARQIVGTVSTIFSGPIERVEAYFTAPLHQTQTGIDPSSSSSVTDPDSVGRQDVIAKLSDADELFRVACESFRDYLPVNDGEEFKLYENVQSMITAIQELANNHPVHRSRMTIASGKLERFSRMLEKSFEIVNIFVDLKPECAGLVWGSLRMIFQLSFNHVTYLEKICDMFERIASTLPEYEEYVGTLQGRAQCQDQSFARLAKTLSHKARFIDSLIWKPFDLQFADMLTRLEEHKAIFELEISHDSTEELLRIYKKYEENLRRVERRPGSDRSNMYYAGIEEASIDARYETLQKWIDPPKWMTSFAQAQSRRSAGTGDWVLKDSVYQNWRSNVRHSGANLAARTLSIQAKPGYGKSVLCTTIIEDLRAYVNVRNSAVNLPLSVVYYFFDKRRGALNSSSDAIRAILAQLIYLHRRSRQAIDLASVILANNETDSSTATETELITILSLFLEQLDCSFLVFDGLDECSDYPELFKRLEEAASGSRVCGVLFLSRPTIQLPARLSKECFTRHLTHLENLEDIEHFLRPNIQELIDIDLLPDDKTAEEIVQLICPRANGMFLWVKLLVEYLRLPALTLGERLEAITHLNRLEGLDALYHAILDGLECQYPGKSRLNVRRIFQWVARARRPLHIDELRIAVSLPLDRPRTMHDIIPNLEKSLGLLSGSLIELASNRVAQFIHLSTQEFFMGVGEYSESSTPDSKAFIYRNFSDRYIAISCLSYLYYTVPAKPLGGSSQVTPDAAFTNSKFPLLKYAAEYWTDHFVYSLKEAGILETDVSSNSSWQQLTRLATAFIGEKQKVTSWIEASWLFSSPRIQDVPEDVDLSLNSAASVKDSFGQISKVLALLRELSDDLKTLNQSWSYILKSEPNEIWEPSILSFTKSRFWIDTNDACVIRLAPLDIDATNCITIQSQISDNGSEISLVRLIPPSSWLHKRAFDEKSGSDAEGWKARYELWSLASKTNVCSVEISLRSSSLSPFLSPQLSPEESEPSTEEPEPSTEWRVLGDLKLSKGDNGGENGQQKTREPTVSLPVAISHDLRRAIILDIAIEIRVSDSSGGEDHKTDETPLRSQMLDFTHPEILFDDFYHIKFSPTGRYFLVIQESQNKQRKGRRYYGVKFLMRAFHDVNHDTGESPNYVSLASIICWAVPEISLLSPCRGLVFHPQLARLAFSQVCDGLPQTYIWNLNTPITATKSLFSCSNPFPVHDPPIVDPCFSDDGCYLYGTDAPLEFGFNEDLRSYSTPLIVKVPDHVPVVASKLDKAAPSRIQTNPFQSLVSIRRAAFELSKRPKPLVQRANSLAFNQDQGGVVHVSQLHQLEKEGAIVLQTFSSNGKFQSDTLSRLPEEVVKCADVSLLHPPPEVASNQARIVLNKVPQRAYTASDIFNNILPAVIERAKESIPTFITTVQMPLGSSHGEEDYYSTHRYLPGLETPERD